MNLTWSKYHRNMSEYDIRRTNTTPSSLPPLTLKPQFVRSEMDGTGIEHVDRQKLGQKTDGRRLLLGRSLVKFKRQ